jgi:hypothetical protein
MGQRGRSPARSLAHSQYPPRRGAAGTAASVRETLPLKSKHSRLVEIIFFIEPWGMPER